MASVDRYLAELIAGSATYLLADLFFGSAARLLDALSTNVLTALFTGSLGELFKRSWSAP